MIAGGPFFKVAAVPFHMWARMLTKAPHFGPHFINRPRQPVSRLRASFFVALGPMQVDWAPLLGCRSLTIVVGNWAHYAENSKRLLAYSSISNAGYLLLAIIA